MKILVLSRNRNLYSTRRIIVSAEKLGHEVRVVDYLRCYMNITSKKPTVIFRGEKLVQKFTGANRKRLEEYLIAALEGKDNKIPGFITK